MFVLHILWRMVVTALLSLIYVYVFYLYAARLLANLIIMGSGIMARAFVQAYRQALANASKNGVAQEAVQNIRRGSKMMTEAEARQILGVTENATWEEILQKYDNLFERNAKNGTFYLQSKRVIVGSFLRVSDMLFGFLSLDANISSG
ncbi:UNVERIFIED_CONTAM: Mitochondrial import inner membrane translocase subunit PAM16 like 2 [Sesamum calycinum]|uniref:Mitochondrial import inner membrane translocase subunit PAM16 like 2 n=1 Tax=Sesamum calycinum TaxID=2727403 RepID=A0AAW2SY41_9LAMI